jgi:S1-C subfamily serine protease
MHFLVEVIDEQTGERPFLMRGEYGCKNTLVQNFSTWLQANLDPLRDDLAWVTHNNANQIAPARRSTSYGSGFFISNSGFAITNAHVVSGSSQIEVRTADKTLPARLVKIDQANDLALLKIDAAVSSLPISTSQSLRLGTSVATIGFPNTDIQGDSPKLAKGEISSLFGLHDDVRHFQISTPLQPGNSGGALFDMRGNVVGVVVAKLDDIATFKRSGSLPENVGYAIKSSYLLGFLQSVPGALESAPPLHALDADFESVVSAAEKSTISVIAR